VIPAAMRIASSRDQRKLRTEKPITSQASAGRPRTLARSCRLRLRR
jgi:hypothetical protein